MIRKFIKIKDQRYDLWEIKSLEEYSEMGEFDDDWVYYIMLNREAIATNLNGVKVRCDSEEDMKEEIERLKMILEDDESIAFL